MKYLMTLSFVCLLAHKAYAVPTVFVPTVFETAARQAILMEASSGQILFEKDADAAVPPASMSKIMTLYLVFEAIKDGRIKRDQPVTISALARSQEGSRMFVNVGEQVSVEDLIHGAIIQSGNDACVALAEAVGGSVEHFVQLMNQKARQLNLSRSTFANPTGLPDPNHMMSARDLATLSAALIRQFPEEYKIYSQREFAWNGINQPNRNPLLTAYQGADGIKTGHTAEAGFCLIGSAIRDNIRLITVVTGLPTSAARGQAAAALLNMGYREFQPLDVAAHHTPLLHLPVVLGTERTVPVYIEQPMRPLLARQKQQPTNIQVSVEYDAALAAPIVKGQEIGKLQLRNASNEILQEVALHAQTDISKGGFAARWSWLWHSIAGGASLPVPIKSN